MRDAWHVTWRRNSARLGNQKTSPLLLQWTMESKEESGQDNGQIQPEDGQPCDDYETLKYHLLGPSLTKAGQDAVDQKKVSAAI